MAAGSIEKLPSGRFRAVVRAGKDPITGQHIKLTETCPDETAARQARDRMLEQLEAESHPSRSATVATLLDRWMEVVDHELNTRATSETYSRRVLVPALGTMQLRKLQHRVDIIDRLYTHLRRCSSLCDGRPFLEHKKDGDHDCDPKKCRPHVCRPMSPSTVRRIHAILSGALGYAVSWGWIDKNPAIYAHPPKLNRRRARPPEAEQVARLLNLAWQTDIELAMFLWLATTTGARRGELAGLRWDRVDLKLGILKIEASYVVRSGQRQLKETKTDRDRRLSLDRLTLQMLTDFREQRATALEPAKLSLASAAFVFTPDPVGLRPWHPDHFSHAYRELADLLDITEPLKNLRHFNATQLLAAGVDLRTTAGRLGHTDGGATTLRVYADWMPATDLKAAEQLSTDLAALRVVQSAAAGLPAGLPSAPTLLSVSRPLQEYLSPPVDGRTTAIQVGEALQCAVRDGHLRPGDLIPTVTQLAAWYGIARSTAQRAVLTLGANNLAYRQGSRWVVGSSESDGLAS